jgi:choline dehydrogenase-like flavoprotein
MRLRTCYHPAGTAGHESDEIAVLDEKRKVRDVKMLMVADLSVVTLLNQGHSQLAAYAIREKAADLVKDTW